MQVQKRSFPMYVFLNCLTLGIYGLIVSMQIDKEVNALCQGDGEEPRFSYIIAVMLRGIAPILGLLVGLVIGLMGASNVGLNFIPGMGAYKAIAVLFAMFYFALIFTLAGSIISGIYLNYWWYKQANRLKLNAWRYGLMVKESGTDNFLFRTVLDLLFLPITIILFILSSAIPAFIIWLITLAGNTGAMVFAAVLLLIFSLPLMLFGMELTTGANFGMFFMFKNLNRFADVCQNGPAPFDPMGYEYYPSHESKYPNFLPKLVEGEIAQLQHNEGTISDGGEVTYDIRTGSLIGEKGSCGGYQFDLSPNEEIIIGKDAKVSSVVIDPAYKEISRKHVGICYDIARDEYRVTDYSSNGTWANGEKLTPGLPTYLPHGTELKLANGKNIFRLG